MMKGRVLLTAVVVACALTVVLPAYAVPHPDCTSCLCQRSHCFIEAERLFEDCVWHAETLGDFFSCENGYDFDRFMCGVEYDLCVFGSLF